MGKEYLLVGPLPSKVRVYGKGGIIWFGPVGLPAWGIRAVWRLGNVYYVALEPVAYKHIKYYHLEDRSILASKLPEGAQRVRELVGTRVSYEWTDPRRYYEDGEIDTYGEPIDAEFIWEGEVIEREEPGVVVWKDPNPDEDITFPQYQSPEPLADVLVREILDEIGAEIAEEAKPNLYSVRFVKVFKSMKKETPLGTASVTYGLGTQTEDFDGNRPAKPLFGHIIEVSVYRKDRALSDRWLLKLDKELSREELLELTKKAPAYMFPHVPRDIVLEVVKNDPELAVFIDEPDDEIKKIYTDWNRKKYDLNNPPNTLKETYKLLYDLDKELWIKEKLLLEDRIKELKEAIPRIFRATLEREGIVPLLRLKPEPSELARFLGRADVVRKALPEWADGAIECHVSGCSGLYPAKFSGASLVVKNYRPLEKVTTLYRKKLAYIRAGETLIVAKPATDRVLRDPSGKGVRARLVLEPPPTIFLDVLTSLKDLGLITVSNSGEIFVVGKRLEDILRALQIPEENIPHWVVTTKKMLKKLGYDVEIGKHPPLAKRPAATSRGGGILECEMREILEIAKRLPEWADGFIVNDYGYAYPVKKSKYGTDNYYMKRSWRPVAKKLVIPKVLALKNKKGVLVTTFFTITQSREYVNITITGTGRNTVGVKK